MRDVRITCFEHRNQIIGVFQFKGRWYLADLIELQHDASRKPTDFSPWEECEQQKLPLIRFFLCIF